MTVSGLLNIFNELPAFAELVAELDEKKSVPPLSLPMSARTAVLAQLYRQRKVPVVLITGKVESAAAWIQALEMWLPPGDVMRRLPEPTPLPYDRGPWSERCRALCCKVACWGHLENLCLRIQASPQRGRQSCVARASSWSGLCAIGRVEVLGDLQPDSN